jgi:hypothetical protein
VYEIDPARQDLAREFKENPLGRHSGELQRVLNRMRGGGNEGRYVLICTKPHQSWVLARQGAAYAAPFSIVPGYQFTSLGEAEWTVFKLRWLELTGEVLPLE